MHHATSLTVHCNSSPFLSVPHPISPHKSTAWIPPPKVVDSASNPVTFDDRLLDKFNAFISFPLGGAGSRSRVLTALFVLLTGHLVRFRALCSLTLSALTMQSTNLVTWS